MYYYIMLTHWSYVFLALTHRCILSSISCCRLIDGLVPQNRDPYTNVLNLNWLTIPMIDHSSFVRYKNISKLKMHMCSMVYVKNGTFNLLWKLENIDLSYNNIIEFPENFGLASDSINKLNLWRSLKYMLVTWLLFFRNFSKLTHLNLGKIDVTPFDSSILPISLTSIILN